MANTTRREQVFFSYSHKDKRWLELFQIALKPLIRANQISAWDDTKIKAGDIWRDEIKQALASAKVAVLLMSMNFLNSDFIAENELPPLLEAAQKEGLKILLVIVGHSLFDETELGRYQAVNDPSRPLASISAASREKEIVRICKEIKSAVSGEGEGGGRQTKPAPAPTVTTPVAGLKIHSDVQITRIRLYPNMPQPHLEVYYRNGSGVIPTTSEIIVGKAFFRSLVLGQDEIDKMFAESVLEASEIPKERWRRRLEMGEGGRDRYEVAELYGVDPNEWVDGPRCVYFMGGILFSDATGHYRKGFCYFLPPLNIPAFHRGSYSSPGDFMRQAMENWWECSPQPSNLRAWEERAAEDGGR